MSLAIITTTNEGNILAADSMETYRNAIGDTREGSMTRMKLFQLNSRIGAVACGLAFLENKNIYQQILRFKQKNDLENKTVKQVVDKLYDFFYEKYQTYMKEAADKKKKDFERRGKKNVQTAIELEAIKVTHNEGEKKYYMPIMEFLVAGNDPDGKNHVIKVIIPDPKTKNGITVKSEGGQPGATWIGQTDVLVRIIRGWSPQLKRSRHIKEMAEKRKHEFLKQMDDQEYLINWGTMTFQDAIEFSVLAIKTTESVQKITDGTWQRPGASPGVGGPIDIAIVTPDKGFVWIQKKKIDTGENVVDLEALPDLPSTPKKKTA